MDGSKNLFSCLGERVMVDPRTVSREEVRFGRVCVWLGAGVQILSSLELWIQDLLFRVTMEEEKEDEQGWKAGEEQDEVQAMEKTKLEKTRDRWAAARVLYQCVKEVSRISKSLKWDKDERPLEDSRSGYALDLDPGGGDGLPRHVLRQSHELKDGWAEEEQAHVQSKPHCYMSPLRDFGPANRPLSAENSRKKGKCEGMGSQSLFAAKLEDMALRREVSLEHPENQTAWVVASGWGGREEGVSREVEDRCNLVRSTEAPLFQMAENRVGILGGTGDDVSCQGQAVETEKVQVVGREQVERQACKISPVPISGGGKLCSEKGIVQIGISLLKVPRALREGSRPQSAKACLTRS